MGWGWSSCFTIGALLVVWALRNSHYSIRRALHIITEPSCIPFSLAYY